MDREELQIICQDLEAVTPAARTILDAVPDGRIFLLSGNLGAGKTELVKSFCKILGSKDAVTSPTFSLVNEYLYSAGEKSIFHMDLYRIEQSFELVDFGFEEYISSGSYCFIEWPKIADEFLDGEMLIKINIEILGESSRRINFIK